MRRWSRRALVAVETLVRYLRWRVRVADPRIVLIMVGVGPLCWPILIYSLATLNLDKALFYWVLQLISFAWFAGPAFAHRTRKVRGIHGHPAPPWRHV